MIEDTQHPETTGWRESDVATPCTTCGEDVVANPAQDGLNCARCGQFHALCDDCMPRVTEYSRDAAWMCPECQRRPLDS